MMVKEIYNVIYVSHEKCPFAQFSVISEFQSFPWSTRDLIYFLEKLIDFFFIFISYFFIYFILPISHVVTSEQIKFRKCSFIIPLALFWIFWWMIYFSFNREWDFFFFVFFDLCNQIIYIQKDHCCGLLVIRIIFLFILSSLAFPG